MAGASLLSWAQGLSTASSLCLLLLLAAGGCTAVGQGEGNVAGLRVYPEFLYGGKNVVSVSAEAGIESVRVIFGDSAMYRSTIVSGTGAVEECPTTHDLTLDLDPYYTSHPFMIDVEVRTCQKEVSRVRLQTWTTWSLDTVLFAEATPGEKVCAFFALTNGGGGGFAQRRAPGTADSDITLIEVTTPDPRLRIEALAAMPQVIRSGMTLRYRVCFASDTAGDFRIPVVIWLKREFPNGGLTSYPVADTAVIRVRE